MTTKTHIYASIAVATPMISLPTLPYMLFVIMGSYFPDIDIKLGIKHRGITHSLVLFFPLVYLISSVNYNVAAFFALGYISHLFLDMLTPMGIKLLYPIYNAKYGLRAFKTGGKVDYLIRAFSIAITAYSAIIKLV